MEVSHFSLEFQKQQINIDEISFGKAKYIYIGSIRREFDDLSVSYPNPPATTHLLGDKPTDELGSFLSDIFKAPVVVSYAFPLTNEDDIERFDFVKISLSKHYAHKNKE